MATHIKEILESFFSQKSKEVTRQQSIDAVVKGVVPAALANHICFSRAHKGIAYFFVDSAPAQYEFSLYKTDVLYALQEHDHSIIDINVKQRNIDDYRIG